MATYKLKYTGAEIDSKLDAVDKLTNMTTNGYTINLQEELDMSNIQYDGSTYTLDVNCSLSKIYQTIDSGLRFSLPFFNNGEPIFTLYNKVSTTFPAHYPITVLILLSYHLSAFFKLTIEIIQNEETQVYDKIVCKISQI